MARDMRAEKHDARVTRDATKRGTSKRGGGASATGMQLDALAWLRLAALQLATLRAGGAVRVGLTRDGGALSVGMYVGEEYGTEYVRPSEDLGEALWEIAEAWLPQGGLAFDAAFEGIAADIVKAATGQPQTPEKGG